MPPPFRPHARVGAKALRHAWWLPGRPRLAPSMEERAEDHPAEGQRMRITDHSPIQHMAAEQGPRDLERRYAIQQQGEAAGTARAGSFGAQPAVGDSEARDPVVAAGFVVADGDPNKKYTNHASSIVQVRATASQGDALSERYTWRRKTGGQAILIDNQFRLSPCIQYLVAVSWMKRL